MLLSQIIIFIFTYFVSGIIIYNLCCKFFKNNEYVNRAELAILSLGIGPIIISLSIYFGFLIFPTHKPWLYLFLVIFVLTIALALAYKQIKITLKEIIIFIKSIPSKFKKQPIEIIIFSIISILIGLYIFIQSVGYPIVSHDGSVYAFHGKYLYHEKNLNNYPMSVSDVATGAYTPLQHPPAMALIYTWFYIGQGHDSSDVLARTVSPVYTFYLIALLWFVLKKRLNVRSAFFGVLMILSTPIFIWQAYENSIDTLRIFFIFSSFIFLEKYLHEKNVKTAILVGLSAGLALYVHVTGLLSLGVIGLMALIMFRGNFKSRLGLGFLILAIAFLIGAPNYIRNNIKFDNIFGPSSYSLREIAVKDFYSVDEKVNNSAGGNLNLSLNSFMPNISQHLSDKFTISIPKDLIFGRMQVFSRIELFGLIYYLAIIGIIYWLKAVKKEEIDWVIFIGMILISIPILYQFYLNRRYILTIHPMAIYFSTIFLSFIYNWLVKKNLHRIFWGFVASAFILIVLFIFNSNSVATSKLGSENKNSTVRYLISNKETQADILSPGFSKALEYINNQTSPDSVIMTFDDGAFFYNTRRKGIFWAGPGLTDWNYLEKDIVYQRLKELKITYIFIDKPFSQGPEFSKTTYKKIIDDNNLVELVFDQGARIYKLK